jgi:hypothetical protein
LVKTIDSTHQLHDGFTPFNSSWTRRRISASGEVAQNEDSFYWAAECGEAGLMVMPAVRVIVIFNARKHLTTQET